MRLGTLIISLIISFFLPLFIWGDSQSLPTNRVYYVDNSRSMENNGLWNVVKSNLKNAISNVTNENDLITVAFFSDKSKGLPIITETANKKGILEIQQFIDSQKETVEATLNTHHYLAFSDFINNRVKSGYVNIMFVLTDGGDEYFKDNVPSGNSIMTSGWNKLLSPNANVYGFYVDLNSSRFKTAKQNIFKGKELPWRMFENGASNHLYIVEGADLDINLIRFDSTPQNIDIRTTTKVKVGYSGKIRNKEDLVFSFSQPNNDFKVSIESTERDSIVLQLSPTNEQQQLPDNSEINLRFSLRRVNKRATNDIGTNRISFLASDRDEDCVKVHFIDDKNRFASIETTGSDKIDIEHYDSFLWSKEHTDTIVSQIKAVFSDAAKNRNCSIKLRFAKSENITIIDESNNQIEEILLSPDKAEVSFKFTSSNNSTYPFEDNIIIELIQFNGLDYVTTGNDIVKSNSDNVTVCDYHIRATKKTNPLIWWLGAFILLLIFLTIILFIARKFNEIRVRNSKPKFPGDNTWKLIFGPISTLYVLDHEDYHNFEIEDPNFTNCNLIDFAGTNQLNLYNLATYCIDKIELLSYKQKNISPHGENGAVIYLRCDFHNCIIKEKEVSRISIIPLHNNQVNIIIYDSKQHILDDIILDFVFVLPDQSLPAGKKISHNTGENLNINITI